MNGAFRDMGVNTFWDFWCWSSIGNLLVQVMAWWRIDYKSLPESVMFHFTNYACAIFWYSPYRSIGCKNTEKRHFCCVILSAKLLLKVTTSNRGNKNKKMTYMGHARIIWGLKIGDYNPVYPSHNLFLWFNHMWIISRSYIQLCNFSCHLSIYLFCAKFCEKSLYLECYASK